MPFPSTVQALSTVPREGTIVTETNELLLASSVGFSNQSTMTVTRTDSTHLSVGNGASSSAPQGIRFNPKNRQITAALTLTITAGTGTGTVQLWARLLSSGSMIFIAVPNDGNTYTLTGTGSLVIPSPGFQPYPGDILFWCWSVTSATFDSTNAGVVFTSGPIGNQQTSQDSWVDAVEVTNITGSAVTLLIEDGQSTPQQLFATASVPANTTVSYVHPGGRFFDSGVFITAGTANALQANVRLARVVRHPQNP